MAEKRLPDPRKAGRFMSKNHSLICEYISTTRTKSLIKNGYLCRKSSKKC